MIRRLKFKFIAATMLSLFTVLGIIIGAINIMNYVTIVSKADETLAFLAENEGRFPSLNDSIIEGIPLTKKPSINPEMPFDSPEMPYETRFFWVLLSEGGEVLGADTESIAAINDSEAASLALNVYRSGNKNGFSDSYRYLSTELDGEIRIIFLDCRRQLNVLNTFLYWSIGISLVGLTAVFIMIFFLSERIVKPIAESYEKQKKFITDAGHDIKTPLTIIDADAELIENDLPDNEWLADIRRQTKRLAKLTSELIYLSKMEEGVTLEKNDFPISDTLEEEIVSFTAPVTTAGKRITASIEPGVFVLGDESAIKKLIAILLDNAVKYSSDSSEIKVSLFKRGRTVQLSVTNTAEELTDELVSQMFDRFSRGDKSRSSAGFGIGLSVAEAIAAAHKGKLYAEKSGCELTINLILPQ